MSRHGLTCRVLLCALLLLTLLACATKKSEGGSSALGLSSVGEEAYVLPPLSEFESFPDEIVADLKAKCAAQGLTLEALSRTKGDSRQSIYADFSGSPPSDVQATGLVAFGVLGANFADLARAVIALPGTDGPQYFVAKGSRLRQFVGPVLDDEKALDAAEFWKGLETEVPPEPSTEDPADESSIKSQG